MYACVFVCVCVRVCVCVCAAVRVHEHVYCLYIKGYARGSTGSTSVSMCILVEGLTRDESHLKKKHI